MFKKYKNSLKFDQLCWEMQIFSNDEIMLFFIFFNV
jgi:hypothetical protein